MNNEIIIASRASPLALKQSEILINLIPSIKTKVLEVVSKGDQIQNVSLQEVGGKGLFIKNLENKLISEEADIAVHSLKDMEWKQPKELKIGAVLKRETRKDLLIGKWKSIFDLPVNAKLGTSSVRRKAFILSHRPDLNITFLRGNINTRIEKFKNGEYDAIILAKAGIQRLNIDVPYSEISSEVMLPSAGQGAIAIQCRSNDKSVLKLLMSINNKLTEYETLSERSFVANLNGTCSSPIGASANIKGDTLFLSGAIASPNGSAVFSDKTSGYYKNAINIGETLANNIIEKNKGFKI